MYFLVIKNNLPADLMKTIHVLTVHVHAIALIAFSSSSIHKGLNMHHFKALEDTYACITTCGDVAHSIWY